MIEELKDLEQQARKLALDQKDERSLTDLRARFLGRKGSLTLLMARLPSPPPTERPKAGQEANRVKQSVQAVFDERLRQIGSASKSEAQKIDVTMPSRPPHSGLEHVLQQATNKIKKTLSSLGFTRLVLENVPVTADIREGDLLESSGLGGRFPVGYPVGRVSSMIIEPTSPYAIVNVRPLAKLDRSRHVLIVSVVNTREEDDSQPDPAEEGGG